MDIDVARAIEEVLHQRKAVHIQGLGSLILEDTPAALSEDALQLRPPSTELRFYETKTKNGPLRKHLMYRNDLSKEEAQKVIKKFSQTAVNALLNYNEVSIKGVAKIKKTEAGYRLKAKKSFINKYYGGLPVIDLPLATSTAPTAENKAIVRPLASAAAVSGAAAAAITGTGKSDSTKPNPQAEPAQSSFAAKVAASNKVKTNSVVREEPIVQSKASPTSTPDPKSSVSKPSAEIPKVAKEANLSKVISQWAPVDDSTTKSAIESKPAEIPNKELPAKPPVSTAKPVEVTKPTFPVKKVPPTPPVKKVNPSEQKATPIIPPTVIKEKPPVKVSVADKSISSIKPQALTLNEKLAKAAESATTKASSSVKSTTAQTTDEIKKKYSLNTPTTQGQVVPPPVYQDEGIGCTGPVLGLLGLLLLGLLLYKGCNMLSKNNGANPSGVEQAISKDSEGAVSSELVDNETSDSESPNNNDKNLEDDASSATATDKPSSCVIITGVFSKYPYVERMSNLLEARGYTVYKEDYGPYTRVGLEYDCSNEDLVDYIQRIRRSVPNAAKAWYLKPELHVDY